MAAQPEVLREIGGKFTNEDELTKIGLTADILSRAVLNTYRLLDRIDATLIDAGAEPLSATVELANLSSMLGNIFAASVVTAADGIFSRNGPHKFPDLLTNQPSITPNIEIKVALEDNKPKGHLVKAGHYITCRYVLCDDHGTPLWKGKHKQRGVTPHIWEIRCGELEDSHFNSSNTDGDSGKTAVVNAEGMKALSIVYVDLERAPLGQRGARYKELVRLCS
ncbi:hypothetical protein ACQHGV_08455 [Sphingomonas pseudosanguinis]|uniref:hypothetical protein n=1 Tax=Sphingomonas pseudosanguinis TaxID=413712 RepID=UPI003F860316